MSTRRTILDKAVRRIGGKTGTLSDVTTTSAVLSGLAGSTGDDSAYVDWSLWAWDSDVSRNLSEWDDSEGKAKWIENASVSGDYALVPPGHFTLTDWRSALDDMLVNTRRSVWNVTKTVSGQLYYSLDSLSHVRTHEDVVAVFRRNHTPDANAGSFEAFDFTENFQRFPVPYKVVESGGVAYLELRSAMEADKELVVVTREPYTALATDATETTCPDSVAVPGLLYYLSRIQRPNVDRERWDRIQAFTGREYAMAARSLTQIPTPQPQRTVVNQGA